MIKVCRFVGGFLLAVLWIILTVSELFNGGAGEVCGITTDVAEKDCLAEPLVPWIGTRNTIVRSKSNSSLTWTWVWKEDEDDQDLHALDKPWSNNTWDLNDTWVVCKRLYAVRPSFDRQCCYAISAKSDADLPDSRMVSIPDTSNTQCNSGKRHWMAMVREFSTLPFMFFGSLAFFFERHTATWVGKKKRKSRVDSVIDVTADSAIGVTADSVIGVTAGSVIDVTAFSLSRMRTLKREDSVIDVPNFSLMSQRGRTAASTMISCMIAIPMANDFLVAYATFDFLKRYRALTKLQQRENQMWKSANWLSSWYHEGLATVCAFGFLCFCKFGFALWKLHVMWGTDPCGKWMSPCDYYFAWVMQFSTRTMLALVCFFGFHISEIQLGVFQEMRDMRLNIEDDSGEEVAGGDNLRQPLSLTQHRDGEGLWDLCFDMTVAIFYSCAIFYLNAEFNSGFAGLTLSKLASPVGMKAMWIVTLSFGAGLLTMQLNWGFWLLTRSINLHSEFVRSTLGGEELTQSKDSPLLEQFPVLDIAKEHDMRTFFNLWTLINIREKEATLIMDNVVSVSTVVLLVNILGCSTTLVFKLFSALTGKTMFVLGSSIFAVTAQGMLNVVLWGGCILRALGICLTYSSTVSKDEKYFRTRSSQLWLSTSISSGRSDKTDSERIERLDQAMMIDRLCDDLKHKNHAMAFFGQPITPGMVARWQVSIIVFLLTLFGTWCLALFSSVS